jgi:hypothetical protein
MDKLLNSPIIIGGALLGAYFILRKQPNYQESRIGKTIQRVADYGENVVDSVVDTGTEVIGGLYETGVDIWGIYDNDDVPDIDTGVDGTDPNQPVIGDTETDDADANGVGGTGGMAEDTEETGADMGGFDGSVSRSSRGFANATLDYNNTF